MGGNFPVTEGCHGRNLIEAETLEECWIQAYSHAHM